jgi:mono/diheme cytochrome c family protein
MSLGLFVLSGLGAATVDAQDLPGKTLYDRWCADCHGLTGAGDGPAAAWMLPRPRDFRRAVYQVRTTASGEIPTDQDLSYIIDEGMPGSAMPGWKSKFGRDERDALVEYIKSFSRFFGDASATAIDFGRPPSTSEAGLAEGREVYESLECFKCHGDAGRGDGPSAPTQTDDWDYPIRPADLSEPWFFNGGGAVEDIYRRLRTGLDGTPMPSFSDAIEGGLITEEQLWRVAQYVGSLGPEDGPVVREVIRAPRIEGPLPAGPDDERWGGVEAFYVPMVGQIIRRPRWFAPTVDGLWAQAVHNGEELALRITWHDPSASPDSTWQEWLDLVAASLTDVDGPISNVPGPDRLNVQWPVRIPDGLERPYFLGGDRKNPVEIWRWTSTPDQIETGTATGLDAFVPRSAAGDVVHSARYDAGEWQLQLTRTLATRDSTISVAMEPGRTTPIAFFAADGSNGEGAVRGSISTWYGIYLDVPTPARAYITPVLVMILTAVLGMTVVLQAQRRHSSGSGSNGKDIS